MQQKPNPNTTEYRVSAPLVASTQDGDGRARFIAIPRGSVIVAPGNLEPLGIVEVEYEGRMISVFTRDIHERAIRVEHIARTEVS